MLSAAWMRHGLIGLGVRAVKVLITAGPAECMRRAMRVLKRIPARAVYSRWAEGRDSLMHQARASFLERQAQWAYRPLISMIMPVYNTNPGWLTEAIESVLAQIYPEWELCIADDASSKPHVRKLLEKYAARDARIKVVYRKTNGHIAAASNSALTLASGEFISLIDHDDLIPEYALHELVRKLNEDPSVDMIYSDEDKIDSKGRRFDPAFKPEWSPEYLESCMYTAHFAMYRKTIVDKIGGFRTGYEGAQDYDFVLRFTENTERVAHVPRVLYHWRAIPGSTAMSMQDKSYVVSAGIRALQERLKRTGRRGSVRQSSYAGCFDVRIELAEYPLVSIVIPTAGRNHKVRGKMVNLISNCVRHIRSLSTYPNYQIIVVANDDLPAPIGKLLSADGCRLVSYSESEFSISKKINLGASVADGAFLILLNDDIEVIRGDWIEAMLEQGLKPGVGVVGAKLLYENDRLQHAGVAHHLGLPDHVRKHFSSKDAGYVFSTISVRNYLAVTGACMLTRKELFQRINGFDEAYKVNYSDIDYCLKVRALGYRTVYTPHAELYHFESASRPAEVAKDEIALYLQRWSAITKKDPYYNAEYLKTDPPDFSLSLRE